jgi:hypothetical protein
MGDLPIEDPSTCVSPSASPIEVYRLTHTPIPERRRAECRTPHKRSSIASPI